MRRKTTIFFQSLKGEKMRKGKCAVCGQDMFDPLLSEGAAFGVRLKTEI